MPSAHDTAYPRLKNILSPKELTNWFTPTAEEFDLARHVAKGTSPRICFLLLLKTFQKLGYFILLSKVPRQIAEHVALLFGTGHRALEWQAYDESGTRRRHVALIRERLRVRPFDDSAQQLLALTVRQGAYSKDDSVDIINIAIEELIRQRYEN